MRSTRAVRTTVAGGCLLALSFIGVSASSSGVAFADGAVVPAAGLPASIPGVWATTEEGLAATEALAVGADVAVCVGAAPACIGAALVIGGAIAIAWAWKSGHSQSYADPPASTPDGVLYQNTSKVYVATAPTVTGTVGARTITFPFNVARGMNGPKLTAYRADNGNACYNGSLNYQGSGSGFGTQTFTFTEGTTYGCQGSAALLHIGVYDDSSTYMSTYTAFAGLSSQRYFDFQAGYVAPSSGGATGTTTVTSTPTSTCSNGTTTTMVTGPPVTYTGGTPSASLPPITVPACPSGYMRTALSTPSTIPGGTTVPAPLTWTAPTIPSTYANCQPGGSASPCVLTLTKTSPDGTKVNCTTTGLCPLYDGTNTMDADGDTYQCKWGPYTMAVSDCTTVPTKQTVATTAATDTANGVKSAGSGTATDSGTDGASCSFAYGWNPVSWVLEPVKCALRWAFVPNEAAWQADVATMRTGWNASGISTWGTALGSLFVGLAGIGTSASGCAGPHFSITLSGHTYAFDPLNACSSPMAGVAVVVKLFISVYLTFYGGRKVVRTLLSSIGMGGAV